VWHPYSIPTASLKIADRQSARSAVASKAVFALCHCLERHATVIILNMHKDNAAAWHLHSALDILYLEAVYAIQIDYNTSIHKMYNNIFIIMNANKIFISV